MKRLTLIAFLAVLTMADAKAQTKVQKDINGNYIALKSDTATKSKAVDTGKYFEDAKGNRFAVFQSKNGKLFYRKTSRKTGIDYNVYLTN